MYFFLAIYLLLFGFLSWKNLKAGLCLVIFALPSYLIRFSLFSIPFTLLEAMILVLFFVWVAKFIIEKKIINFSSYKYLILLFLFAGFVSIFISSNLFAALGIYKAYFIEPILFFLVFINVYKKDDKDLKYFLYSIGFSSLLISLFCIFQKFTGYFIPNDFWQAEATRRVTGFFGYPNAVGLYLGPIIVLFFGFFIFNKFANRIFSSAVVVLSFMAIIFAVSEGAIIGVLAGCFILLLFIKKIRLYAVGLLAISSILLFSIPKTKNFIAEKALLQDVSGQIRLEMWQETWQMLKTKPIFGAGLSGYQNAVALYHSKDYIEIYLYPHNIILNFWTETGILGLLAFILILIKFFIDSYKKRKNILSVVLFCAMIGILIHGLVDVPYLKNDLSMFFWLLVGLGELE